MKINTIFNSRGFSLVEWVMATLIFVFVLGALGMVTKTIFQGSQSVNLRGKVNAAMQQVYEEMLDESRVNWGMMTDNGLDRTPEEFQKHGTILTTVKPPDATKRTFEGIITAYWKDIQGDDQETRLVVTFSNTQGKQRGARVIVTIVDGVTSLPIVGKNVPLICEMAGEIIATVSVTVNDYGECVLDEVHQGNNETLTIKSNGTGYYFKSPVELNRAVNPVATQANTTVYMNDTAWPPSKLTGRVHDLSQCSPTPNPGTPYNATNSDLCSSNQAGLEGVKVGVYIKSLPSGFPTNTVGTILYGWSDANGDYEVFPMYPGSSSDYYAFVLGDTANIPAGAIPGDDVESSGTTAFERTNFADGDFVDFALPPAMGVLTGTVHDVTYNGGSSVYQAGSVQSGVDWRFHRRRFGYFTHHGANIYNLKKTNAWEKHIKDDIVRFLERDTTASGGTFSFTEDSPMIHDDGRIDVWDEQYSPVIIKTDAVAKDPLTPINVYNAGSPATTIFAFNGSNSDPDFVVIRPQSATLDNLEHKVYFNQTTNADVDLLNRSALSTVTGTLIMDGGDNDGDPCVTGFGGDDACQGAGGVARVILNEGGKDGVGAFQADLTNNLQLDTEAEVPIDAPDYNTFAFDTSGALDWFIPPNVGNPMGQTVFTYEAIYGANDTKNFKLYAIGYSKEKISGSIKIVPYNLDIDPYSVDFYDKKFGGNLDFTYSFDIDTGVDVTNSPQPIDRMQRFLGSSDDPNNGDNSPSIQPGTRPQAVNVYVWHMGYDFYTSYYGYGPQSAVTDDSGDKWMPFPNVWQNGRQEFRYTDTGGADEYRGTYKFKKKITLNFMGRIVDKSTGDPIIGAPVQVRISQPWQQYNITSQAQAGSAGACGGQNCQYSQTRTVILRVGWNVRLRVTAAGYDNKTVYRQVYDPSPNVLGIIRLDKSQGGGGGGL